MSMAARASVRTAQALADEREHRLALGRIDVGKCGAVDDDVRADGPDRGVDRVGIRQIQLMAAKGHHFVTGGELRSHRFAELPAGAGDQHQLLHRDVWKNSAMLCTT